MRRQKIATKKRNPVMPVPCVVKSPVTCCACGMTIEKDNWAFKTPQARSWIHDNTVCIEVWKCRHGIPYDRFKVSMRMSAVVEE